MSFSERLDAVVSHAPHKAVVTTNPTRIATIEVDGPIGTKLLSAIRRNQLKIIYIDDGDSLKFKVQLLDKV